MNGRKSIDDIVADDLAANPDLPDVPEIDVGDADKDSTAYSQHRTKLSTHRTALSMHRTHLSEHRTTLSDGRTEMSRRRTGMSFQRTRLSAERTLMGVIRTSLSLISFGFTIYQFFEHLQEKRLVDGGQYAARNFGLALVYLGVAVLVIGIVYHMQFMLGLRHERSEMTDSGMVHSQSRFPVSFTLITAVLLLMLGIMAGTSLTFHVGPFG